MAATMDETTRLDALAQANILDTPPEPEFDELAALAAYVCGTPMAIITLIDEKRQWFKSQFGLTMNERRAPSRFAISRFNRQD